MASSPSRPTFPMRAALFACLVLALAAPCRSLWAYTPQSPEVIEMIQAALNYLQGAEEKGPPGAHFLIGLTLVKNNYGESHPLVARGIRVCRESRRRMRDLTNYDVGLAIIFLCEAVPQERELIQAYLNELMSRQLPNGAWSYPEEKGGDTSQTQYGVLAMWTAKNSGFQINNLAILKVCDWLIMSRDAKSGGWVYHPYDSNEERKPTVSLCAAGLGSLYICADMLGIKSKPAPPKPEKGLPPALVRVAKPAAETEEGPSVEVTGIDKQRMGVVIRDGNTFMARQYPVEIAQGSSARFAFYALYAVERYRSFREKAERLTDNGWYDHGVEYMKAKQRKDGSFHDIFGASGPAGVYVQTSFAVLFLMRSTKKSIGAMSQGQLKGGIGLPSNNSKMRLYGGRIVAAEVDRSLSELMDLIDDEKTGELSDLLQFSPDALATMPSDPEEYALHMQRLRGLVSHPSPEIRRVVVKTLAQARDLDNVPALIFALTDEDTIVIKAARDGLRFVSRKVDGFGLVPEKDATAQQAAAEAWKEWYRAIRPDAEFIAAESN